MKNPNNWCADMVLKWVEKKDIYSHSDAVLWKMLVVIRLWCRITLRRSLNMLMILYEHHIGLSLTRFVTERSFIPSGKTDISPISKTVWILDHDFSSDPLHYAETQQKLDSLHTWKFWLSFGHFFFWSAVTTDFGGWISLIWTGSSPWAWH